MKNIYSVIVLTRKSNGSRSNHVDMRLRVGAKSEKEAEKIVREYCKKNNLIRGVKAYYIDYNKPIAYKAIINDLTNEILS